jgi:multiple antibiotic resistance protein
MSINATLALLQMAGATAADAQDYKIAPSKLFLLFFIMLGPVKVIGPYYVATKNLQPHELRKLSLKVFAFSAIAVLLAGLIGSGMMRSWEIDPIAMRFAAGLVFLLVALQMVLSQYQDPVMPSTGSGSPNVMHLVFPITVTPYGIAALIVLMALSHDLQRSILVLGFALVVLVLNLLSMLAVRPLMRWIGGVPLQIFGAVLGILQVALAVQFIMGAVRDAGWLAMQGH